MVKAKFDNMEIDSKVVEDIENNFEDIRGDGTFYVSKEEFEHKEEGLNFKYKYVIEVIDMEEYTGEDGAHIELELVISPEDIHEEVAEDIMNTFGMDVSGYDLGYLDIQQYGNGIRMATEGFEEYKEEEIKEKLNILGTLLPTIDSIRGFKLDRAWNMIGTTGWDTIKHVLYNEEFFGSF